MTIILNGTTGLSGVDGSAGTPALQGTDANTGISFGTDIVTINTGGQARVTTDASGNVGVGSTTPSGRLEVSGSSCIRWQTTDANFINEISTNPAKNAYVGRTYDASSHVWKLSSSNQMTFDSSGNLGLGVTPSAWTGGFKALEMSNGSVSINANGPFVNQNAVFAGGWKYTATGAAAQYQQIAGAHQWFNAPSGTAGNAISFTQAMTLDASGNLLVGTTSALAKLTLDFSNATEAFSFRNTSAAAGKRRRITTDATNTFYIVDQNTTGVSLGDGATSWGTVSDERHKDIIEPITNAAEKVSTLRPVIGKYKTDEEGTRRAFLIAQDVEKVLPEAVDKSDSENWALRYTETVPLLVAAIQEQQAIITQLQADVAALKGAA